MATVVSYADRVFEEGRTEDNLNKINVRFTRWGICIGMSNAPGGYTPQIWWEDLSWDIFRKYAWYFEYRAALMKVRNPKKYIEVKIWTRDYAPPLTDEIKLLGNKITNKRGKITQYRNQIAKGDAAWNKLFPVEDDPNRIRSMAKIGELERELVRMEQELAALIEQQKTQTC